MIAFDNGPANGDYVRYIDDLMKSAAIAASAGVLTYNDGDGTLGRTRDRLAALALQSANRVTAQALTNAARPGSSATPAAWTPSTPDLARRAAQDGVQTTGFSAPVAATASATAAAAIASALMSGQMGQRGALATHMKTGIGVIAIGILLVLFGLLWTPFNFLLVVGGGAAIAWAVRMMRDASARGSSTGG